MKPKILLTALVCSFLLPAAARAGLVSYQSLDSGAGLTLNNGAAVTTGGQGKLGEALVLDGVDDSAQVIAGSGITGGATRTIAAWVYQDSGVTGLRTPVALGTNVSGGKWDFDIDNANGGLEVGVNGGRTTGTGLTGLSGSWIMVVSTLPVTSGTLTDVQTYLNGSLTIATGVTKTVNTSGTTFLLGVSANTNIQYLQGLIDDVAIWNEALTADEIKAFYDVGNSVELAYTANVFDSLKQVHDAGSGAAEVGGLRWRYATGLGNTAGLSGSAGNYTLVLDATAGTGVVGVPPVTVSWGGAGSTGSPELWSSASDSDPTHWNQVTPPDMTGPDDAIINGGGIHKDAGLAFSNGSTMTLNSGAFLRLDDTATNNFTIFSGASLVIQDGNFDCNTASVTVAGAKSLLEVVSGSFVFDAQTTFAFGLNTGATAIVRSGGVLESTTFFNSNNVTGSTVGGTFLIDGGTLLASGPQSNPLRAAQGLDGGGYDFTSVGGTIQIDNFTGGDLTAYLEGLATTGFFKIDGVTVSGFGTSDAVNFGYLSLTDNGTSGSLVLTAVPPVVWGGAGTAGSPEPWDSVSNSDPTHWNRATPPDMTGVDKAIINGGGIQKDAPHTFSNGSSMTVNSGAFFRLNATATDNFTITSGASLVINDGTFNSNTAAVTVSGANSLIEVVNGSFVFNAQATFGFGLNNGATAIVRAGGLLESTTFFNSQNGNTAVGGTFRIDGGTLLASGPQSDPLRAGFGLDGGGYDFTSLGGKIQIDDFTGGDLTAYLEGLATGGFFKIGGVTVSGFGSSNAVSGQNLILTDNGTSGSVVLTAVSGGFASWIAGFPVGGLNGLVDNPDHGRLPNGLEYLLGGNPTAPNDTALPVVSTEPTDLVLTFDRDDQSIGSLEVVVEVSTDLVTWPVGDSIVIGADTGSSGAGVTITDNGSTDAVEVRIPRGLDSKKYARIRVNLP